MSVASVASIRVSGGTRFAVLAALCGQLAILAHGALVEHVTCGVDGDLIHVRVDVAPAVPPHGDVVRAVTDAGHDEHDRCLLDEDGEAACPNAHVAASAPVLAERAQLSSARRAPPRARRAPLYRLAPKNSPPA